MGSYKLRHVNLKTEVFPESTVWRGLGKRVQGRLTGRQPLAIVAQVIFLGFSNETTIFQ